MSHFSSSKWLDLVLCVADSATRDAMERHLKDGCAECAAAHRLWQRLLAFAGPERAAEPPGDAVRVAKPYLASHVMATNRAVHDQLEPGVPTVVAALVFDSLLEALPAGLRLAGTNAGRLLLYDAAPFVIDLQIDTASRSDRSVLAGHVVTTTAGPRDALQHLRVRLSSGADELVTMTPNQVGDFQCEFETKADLSLRLSMPQHVILIPLPLLSEPG